MQIQVKKTRQQQKQEGKPDHHVFTSLATYEREHPRAARHCFLSWGARFSRPAWLKNPTKHSQRLRIFLGHFDEKDRNSLRGEECYVHVLIAPGETRELPEPFADVAHLVDGETNQVVGGQAPALRRLEKDASGELVDLTPEMHASLGDSVPDESNTKPRAKRR